MHTHQERQRYLTNLKKRTKKEGWTKRDALSAARWLHRLLTTSDAWEWMLIEDDGESQKDAVKQLTILLMHAKKTDNQALYRYLDKAFAVYYHVFVYKRTITHPKVRLLIEECKRDTSVLKAFLEND